MQKTTDKALYSLLLSMFIFGTIGVIRKNVTFPSAFIAGVRGIAGALFLMCFNRKFNRQAVKKDLPLLITAGVLIGINWIFFFESQRYTSIAVATMCYYTAPIIVILISPFILKEKLSLNKIIATALAAAGVVLLAGKAEGASVKGVTLGLCAAVGYATQLFVNKFVKYADGLDRTIVPILTAGIVSLPYSLATETIPSPDIKSIVFLVIICIIHTGIAYALYFSSIKHLEAQTVALASFLDPATAVVCSTLLLREEISLYSGIGCLLIFVAIITASENLFRKKSK